MFPFPPSEMEANFYYAGLPSAPALVARTSTTPWEAPTGLEAYQNIKELRAVGNHALKEAWEDDLALKLHALLDSMKVKWTSTDVVRIGDAGEPSTPIILWIGVMPASLAGNGGVFGDAAFKKYLESIKAGIGGKAIMAQYQERRIKAIEGKGDPAANRERQEAQAELDKAMAVMEELNDFYRNILTH